MKRKLLITAIGLLILAAGVFFVGKQLLVGYLTPDFLVKQMESRWNCRADVASVEVNLLGAAATVELKGVALAPRDHFADDGIALADRIAIPEGTAEMVSDSVLLEILPAELIKRQLNIRRLILDGLTISTTINREGGASIQKLFEHRNSSDPLLSAGANGQESKRTMSSTPLAIAGTADAAAESSEETITVIVPPGAVKDVSNDSGTKGMDFATMADRIEVKNGQLNFHVEASGADIRLEAFQLALTEIDVDPRDLETHNRTSFSYGADLIVQPPAEKGTEAYLRAHITGEGRATPFLPETGDLDPSWTTDLTIHEGAQINTFPLIDKLQKLLKGVDTAGVTLDDINIRGTLLADATTQIGQFQGKYLFKKPLELALPDTVLMIQEGSWLHTGTNQHKMGGLMVASETLTKKIEEKVDVYLEKKAGNFASENLRNVVLSPVMREGHLAIEFSSKGDLADPKADIVTPFGNLSEVLDTGKDTLKSLEKVGKSLLKNLFGN
ncbi:MAG: hypothetical protein KDN20_05270 [Verrucomicrobiae bacterium]|nr:hypothetical protein [Verrucomicrobiae bacterium]